MGVKQVWVVSLKWREEILHTLQDQVPGLDPAAAQGAGVAHLVQVVLEVDHHTREEDEQDLILQDLTRPDLILQDLLTLQFQKNHLKRHTGLVFLRLLVMYQVNI